jgi:argininosuccinate lyase
LTPPADKPWSGRFTERADAAAERFTASLGFDRRLGRYDVTGSVAWARALRRAGLLTDDECATIVGGLERIRRELEDGSFPFRPELEDIHMNVERRLIELVGAAGGKLHTGRSRNDQIALDERLYLRDVVGRVREGLRQAQDALVARAGETVDAPMPGYTHLQRAQPIVLAHHLLAYVFMLERDRARFAAAAARADVLPLGSGALAGTGFPIDRHALARDLGFGAVSPNSIDAVSDRDYVIEFLAAAAITGMHLSRLAADLTLWATAEFGFVEFPDAFATGSSLMPQKKNPDVAELIRGKSGRLYGDLVAVLTALKGLPLAYNSDMQEDSRRAAAAAPHADVPDRSDAGGGRRAVRDRDRSRRLPRPQGTAVS